VVHPTVHTTPVENMLAVRQPPDLLPSLELVQAHGAALRRVSGGGGLEFNDGEEFSDQGG